MKVLYTIYSKRGSIGGHLFSLEHILTSLSGYVDVVVMHINHYSEFVDNLPFETVHLSPEQINRKDINRILNDIAPDVIHCFDAQSYLILSYYTFFKNYKFVLTKPGGKISKYCFYSPYCKDYVLFSQENFRSLKSNLRFISSNLHLIPNRVNGKLLSINKREETKTFTFFQVIRINKGKHQQILKSLNLILLLKRKGINVNFILAGVVNHKEELSFINRYIKDNQLDENISIITDERAKKGSSLLYLGDCIIGTGRSVMEAACLGKVILVPNNKTDFPILLDNDSFNDLFEYNFSGRSNRNTDDTEWNKIIKLVSDINYRNDVLLNIKEICNLHFLITADIIEKYLNIYKSLKKSNVIALLLLNFHLYYRLIRGTNNKYIKL